MFVLAFSSFPTFLIFVLCPPPPHHQTLLYHLPLALLRPIRQKGESPLFFPSRHLVFGLTLRMHTLAVF